MTKMRLTSSSVVAFSIFILLINLCTLSFSASSKKTKKVKNLTANSAKSAMRRTSQSNVIGGGARLNSILMNNPLAGMSVPQIVEYYGYPCETHKVTTRDGYILTMHRIPAGKDGRGVRNSRVVFLQHGVLGTSFEYFYNIPKNLLALNLADAGYDVWIGNSRGNIYSRKHVNMVDTDVRYWDWTIDEMGTLDLSSEIDYTLSVTGQSQLYFIGYSLGATQFFILMSNLPEYNRKIKLLVALAPAVYLSEIQGLIRLTTLLDIPIIHDPLRILFNGEFPPPWIILLIKLVVPAFCSIQPLSLLICSNILFVIGGFDPDQIQLEALPPFYANAPSVTSADAGIHLVQFIGEASFRKYSYGQQENLRRYGSRKPPLYSLKRTTTPVAIIHGPNDALVPSSGVHRLASELSNVVFKSPVNHSAWNHFDYNIGRDVDTLIIEPVLKLLSQY